MRKRFPFIVTIDHFISADCVQEYEDIVRDLIKTRVRRINGGFCFGGLLTFIRMRLFTRRQ